IDQQAGVRRMQVEQAGMLEALQRLEQPPHGFPGAGFGEAQQQRAVAGAQPLRVHAAPSSRPFVSGSSQMMAAAATKKNAVMPSAPPMPVRSANQPTVNGASALNARPAL